MSGSSGTSSAQTQTAAWKTGLGVVTEATDQDRAGKIELAAAAVLLDGEGKLESVLLDELEVSVSADSTGHVTLPADWRGLFPEKGLDGTGGCLCQLPDRHDPGTGLHAQSG